ncbi:MAG: hypothetical protein AAF417_13480 [Pseudomonadota bacterium]
MISTLLRGGSASRTHGLLLVPTLILGACGTVTAIVPDAEGVEHISAIGMGCNKPYPLTQDCSGFSGAKRLIEINDFRYKIAGSEDGTVVLMMGAKPNSDAWKGKSTETANVAYEVTKKYLADNGIRVTKAEPVSSGTLLAGYVITTTGDAYSQLSTRTVEE